MNRSMHTARNKQEIAKRIASIRPIRVTSEDEREFALALQDYKESSGRMFPTWSELLEVLHALGYAKRIWKPVGAWAPTLAEDQGISSAEPGQVEVLGWFARVETQSIQ